MLGLIGAVALIASLAPRWGMPARQRSSSPAADRRHRRCRTQPPSEEVPRPEDHVRRRLGRHRSRARHGAGQALHQGHRDQGQRAPHPAASDQAYSQLVRAFSSEVVLDRRGDDRRRLAGRLRAVPGQPEAEARQAVEAPCSRDRLERHRQREARRDAVVRRLRNPLLPHRPAEEVRLQGSAEDLERPLQDGQEDPGRRAEDKCQLLRLRLPGQLVRGPDLQRARVDRVRGWRSFRRQRQGLDQQLQGGRRFWTRCGTRSARRRLAA